MAVPYRAGKADNSPRFRLAIRASRTGAGPGSNEWNAVAVMRTACGPAQLCGKSVVQKTSPTSVDCVPAWLIAASAVRSPPARFSTPATAR